MTVEDEGRVIITLADIYRQVIAMSARLDASLAKADRMDQIIAEHETDLRPLVGAADRLTDHEARLRTLERGRWPLASVTVLVALGALAVSILVALYGHK